MHSPLEAWSLIALSLTVVGEVALLYAAPSILARLVARFPFALERKLSVPFAVVTNGVDPKIAITGQNHAGGWVAEHSFAWVRPDPQPMAFNRSLAIGRIDVEVRIVPADGGPYRMAREPAGATVTLSARWAPVPSSFLLVLLSGLLVGIARGQSGAEIVISMGCVALFLVVVLAMSHAQVHPALSIAANRIAQELSRQSQQAQGAAAASEVSAAS